MSEWRVVALAAIVWVIGCNDFSCPEPAVSGPGTTCVCPEGMLWTGTGCGLDPDAGSDAGDAGVDAPDAGDAGTDAAIDTATCTLGTVTDCASCGDVCVSDNATPSCEMGGCTIGECDTGFDDCNGRASDGCEAELASDGENCGECGVRCDTGLSCVEGICQDPVVDVTLFNRFLDTEANGCVVGESGRLYCWGNNEHGQLPGAETTTALRPVEVGSDFSAVDCGFRFCCGIRTDRTVSCWGSDEEGALGDGPVDSSGSGFVTAVGVRDVFQISVGASMVCARSLSTLWCWGEDIGARAAGSSGTIDTPEDMGVFNPVDVGVSYDHACVVTGTGLLCWGSNASGQLGDGTTEPRRRVPFVGMSGVTAVGVAAFHTCASMADGVSCWGYFADADTYRLPTEISGLSGEEELVAGQLQSCALTDGRPSCWGFNFPDAFSLEPREVTFGAGEIVDFEEEIEAYCAVTSSGALFCWGNNQAGQLGIGEVSSPDEPVPSPIRVVVP